MKFPFCGLKQAKLALLSAQLLISTMKTLSDIVLLIILCFNFNEMTFGSDELFIDRDIVSFVFNIEP